MKRLTDFLRKFETIRGDKHANLGSLQGGLYKIPESEASTFFDLWASSAKHFTQKQFQSLVFRPPRNKIQPLCMDIDFKTVNEYAPGAKSMTGFALEIAKRIGVLTRFVVVAKQRGYFKVVNDKNVFCTGFHIYFPGSECDLAFAQTIRRFSMEILPKFFADNYLNPVDDIVDKRIPCRYNGHKKAVIAQSAAGL